MKRAVVTQLREEKLSEHLDFKHSYCERYRCLSINALLFFCPAGLDGKMHFGITSVNLE